tara:strand:+ start:2001 stop:3017 length:1017 start_codon:yes stop_codon:yes gene_type:complete
MIKDLSFEQEQNLANKIYYGGGYTKKYSKGGRLSKEDYANASPEAQADDDALKKENTSAQLGAGLGLAGAAITAFDKDPGYGNADVASSAVKYAAMGAAAGPVGALVGGVVGLGVGLMQKKKFQKEEKKAELKKEQAEGYNMFMKDQEEFAGYQDGGVVKEKPELSFEEKMKRHSLQRDGKLLDYIEEENFKQKIASDSFKFDFLKEFDNPYMDKTQTNTKPFIESDSVRLQNFVRRDKNVPVTQDMLEMAGAGISADKMKFAQNFQTGGMTQGQYSHSSNPLKVVNKSGQDTGMELTGGEGVFDKPFMGKLQGLLTGGKYQEAGKAVQNEMKTWKHK